MNHEKMPPLTTIDPTPHCEITTRTDGGVRLLARWDQGWPLSIPDVIVDFDSVDQMNEVMSMFDWWTDVSVD